MAEYDRTSPSGTIDIYNKDANGDSIAWICSVLGVHVGPKDREEVAANAKLIEAAPDLLAACLLAYVKLTSRGECNDDATAKILSEAIQKATE